MTQSGATTLGKSGPGSDVNEGVLSIPQSFKIKGVSRSDFLVSYPGHLLGDSYSFADVLLVYSSALADRATKKLIRRSLTPLQKSSWSILQPSLQTPGSSEMKENVSKEYLKRIRKLLETKHSSRNFVK